MKKPVSAWIFIIIGVLLLLNQFDLLFFDRFTIVFAGSVLFGVLLLNKSYKHPLKKGILGGTFFILFAVILLLMRFNFLPVNDKVGTGLIFVLLGFSNIIYFLFYPKKTANIIYALLFLLLSAPLFLDYYSVMPGWMLEHYFATYWPVFLILIGLGLLLEGLRRRKPKTVDFSK